jgi:UDP-glucose 6-dehydrogenase
MNTQKNIESFVSALKESGVSINDEQSLIKRLVASKDAEVELIKIASNSTASKITFTATLNTPADKLSKAFLNHGFDGFAFHQFIPCLKM